MLDEFARQLGDDYLPEGWERVASSAFARVARNPSLQLYYKLYLPRSPAESLKALLRGSRASRARKNAEALLALGIDAPANVHWGELPGGREYLFTASAPGRPLSEWLRERPAAGDTGALRLRWQLLEATGVFVGRMHYTGFIHGDLRPGNLLADYPQHRFRFFLVDNERNLRKIPPPGRMLLRNLMQLNMLPPGDLSRTDRMRFFRAWRRQMRDLSPTEAKVLAGEAYQWALRRMREQGAT